MKRIIEYLLPSRRLALAIALASAVILGAAYVSQYGFGLKPCILCLYQRIPYWVNIALGLAAFIATYRYPRLTVLLIYAAAASFFANAVIAGFHVGVEQGWWPGLPACGGQIVPMNATLEELRASLARQDIVRCDKAAWTLFGISMAGYNFILSLLLGAGVIYMRKKRAA